MKCFFAPLVESFGILEQTDCAGRRFGAGSVTEIRYYFDPWIPTLFQLRFRTKLALVFSFYAASVVMCSDHVNVHVYSLGTYRI